MGGSVPGPHPLTLIYHFSVSEKVPFSYTFYWQIVSLSQTVCIPLNCCKDTVFKTWINPKPARFLDIFTALLGLLKTEMTGSTPPSWRGDCDPGYYDHALSTLVLPGFILLSIQGRKLVVSNKLQYNHLLKCFFSLERSFHLTIIHLCGLISLTCHLRWPPLIL